MECLDCGKSFDKEDLLAMTCKGCGEPLMPEDVKNLEAKLGIAKEVPEVEVPVLVPYMALNYRCNGRTML